MLFNVLKTKVTKEGLTEALRQKIDLLYVLERLTTEQYNELIGSENK